MKQIAIIVAYCCSTESAQVESNASIEYSSQKPAIAHPSFQDGLKVSEKEGCGNWDFGLWTILLKLAIPFNSVGQRNLCPRFIPEIEVKIVLAWNSRDGDGCLTLVDGVGTFGKGFQ